MLVLNPSFFILLVLFLYSSWTAFISVKLMFVFSSASQSFDWWTLSYSFLKLTYWRCSFWFRAFFFSIIWVIVHRLIWLSVLQLPCHSIRLQFSLSPAFHELSRQWRARRFLDSCRRHSYISSYVSFLYIYDDLHSSGLFFPLRHFWNRLASCLQLLYYWWGCYGSYLCIRFYYSFLSSANNLA